MLFDRAVSPGAVGRYYSLAWGRSSIAHASLTVYRRARQWPIFHDYVQTTLLFAVFPGIHVAQKVFVMISSTERSFLCPLWGTFVFFMEGRRVALHRLAVAKWLKNAPTYVLKVH